MTYTIDNPLQPVSIPSYLLLETQCVFVAEGLHGDVDLERYTTSALGEGVVCCEVHEDPLYEVSS